LDAAPTRMKGILGTANPPTGMPKKEKEEFNVPQHTHCKVCGKAIPLGQVYCSKECMEKDRKQQHRSSTMFTVYMGVVAAVFLVLIFITAHFK